MSPPYHRLASLLTSCAIALVATGCHAPWSIADDDFQRSDVPPTTATTSPPRSTTNAPPTPATDADLAGVLDKLQQVGDLDPSAQQKLMDELQRTEPRFWPAVAEQFRASLAYHQELAASKRLAGLESDTPPHPGSESRHTTAAESRPVLAPPYRIPASPSTPLGSLVDPRNADADGVSSEALARVAPSAQKPPPGQFAADQNGTDADSPAKFETDGAAFPIAAQRREHTPHASPSSSDVIRASFSTPATPAAPARSAPAGKSDVTKKEWQQLVAEAADDLSRRVAVSPATTAEIHQHVSLRILRLLAGETEAALEPIPHIAPVEQDYWSRQIFALATYLDHHGQPDNNRRAAASAIHLDEAVAHLRELGTLSLRNLAFCKNIYGYGAIEPYKEDRFSPGQEVTLYVEVENYHSQSTEKGFTTSLGSTYEILDEKGERVDGGEFPNVDDCCRSRRRDFHIQFGLTLPENIAPGRYQLELVVRDRQSDKIAPATAHFEIHQ